MQLLRQYVPSVPSPCLKSPLHVLKLQGGEKWIKVVFRGAICLLTHLQGLQFVAWRSCHQPDSKGRLAIPTKFRDWLRDESDGQLVCTIDIAHPCLLLYPLNEWEEVERKLKTLSSMNPQERRLQRLLLGHATECELDGNGRLLLSQPLRNHAGLDKKIMLVGQLNKFELWDEARWQQQVNDDILGLPGDDWASSPRLQDFSL